MSTSPLVIDGSLGEGGGQVLRTSLTLALLTGRPFEMHSIRAGRKSPGLRAQHLAAVRAAAAISNAELDGDAIGSTSLRFEPGAVQSGAYTFDIGTAGSTTLLLQTLVLPLSEAAGSSQVRVVGGTHNPLAPPFEALDRSFLPALSALGHTLELTLERPGFYPRGGGAVTLHVGPSRMVHDPVDWTRRAAGVRLALHVLLGQLPRHVAEREIETVVRGLGWDRRRIDAEIVERDDVLCPGNALSLIVRGEPFDEVFTVLGERGLPAERVARRLIREAKPYLASDVPVGSHLADQLLLPLARAGGGAFRTLPPTEHARTQARLLETWLGLRIDVRAEEGGETFHVDVPGAA